MGILTLRFFFGMEAWVAGLHVGETYRGLFEGYPDHASNNEHLTYLRAGKGEERRFIGRFPVYVIEPERETREYNKGRAPFTQPEFLPRFEFHALCFADGWDTCLVLAWFQDAVFPMPSESVTNKLASVEWKKHAKPFVR